MEIASGKLIVYSGKTTSEHLSEITAEFVTGNSAPSGQANLNEHSTLSVTRRSTPLVSGVVDTYNLKHSYRTR
jgi:hypothetical protein